MQKKLKPCPFCGKDATADEIDDYLEGIVLSYGCEDCSVRYSTVERWNRRTPGPATAAMVERAMLILETDQDPGFSYGMLAAFLAEHEPAKEGGRG